MGRRHWSKAPAGNPPAEVVTDPRHSSLRVRVDHAAQSAIPSLDALPEEAIARAVSLLGATVGRRRQITNRAMRRFAASLGWVAQNRNGRPEGGDGYALALAALDEAERRLETREGLPTPKKRRTGRIIDDAERQRELAACGLANDLAREIAVAARYVRDTHGNARLGMCDGMRLADYLTAWGIAGKLFSAVCATVSQWDLDKA